MPQHSLTASTGVKHLHHVPGRMSGRTLLLARVGWLVIAAMSFAASVMSFPYYATHLQILCAPHTGCVSIFTPGGIQALQDIGVPLGSYVVVSIALSVVEMLIGCGIGCLIFCYRSYDLTALLVALMLFLDGTNNVLGRLTDVVSPWQFPARVESMIFVTLVFLVLSLFPDGRFVPGFTRWLVLGLFLLRGLALIFPPQQPETGFQLLADVYWFAGIFCLMIAQIYRYRRESHQVERQKTKWIVFGVAIVAMIEIGTAFPLVLSSFFPSLAPGPQYSLLFMLLLPVVLLAVPITFAIAILRYQLWDIDIIINRTLLYGALTASIIGIYMLVVASLGVLLKSQGNFLISLLATGLIAVLFQPLRLWLQRRINRLMYGQRDEPYAVISHLGSRLEATLAPDAVLPTIVETVAQALKLPYAAITLQHEQAAPIMASYGIAVEPMLHLPLLYQSEYVGELLLAPRAKGESFTPADRRLLEDLTHQVGIAVHAVRLTADLQLSRQRLVRAREEERRRLRRDLHDGLGPTLATITVKAEAARDAIAAEPAQAIILLEELVGQAQTAISDIRRLVYNLRPPALDDLGLVAAIRTQAVHYERPGLQINTEVPEPLPELPAAAEVAAYRIVQEALTNVVRHANAHSCLIRLAFDGVLHLSVTDDGCGIPVDREAGVGLRSMQERAEELGGSCVIGALSGNGTTVQVSLPCSSDERHAVQELV